MDNNRELFEEMYGEYAVEIKRFIFTIARRDSEHTSEIFQNTWVNAYRYISSLKDETSARAWLYAIARTESKRYFADKNVRFFDNVLPLPGTGIDNDFNGSEPTDTEAETFPDSLANEDLLASLLSKIGADWQRLILLHYYWGLSLKEIAEQAGTNYNTVKSSFRRAIAKLREIAPEKNGELS